MSFILRTIRNFPDKQSLWDVCVLNMKRSSWTRVPRCHLCATPQIRKQTPENFEPDEPIKFSTSKAKTWRSIDGFALPKHFVERPSYQPYIVSLSMAVFLLYFCYLRESNDLDEEIGKSLYEKVPSLEEQNLRASIEYEHLQGRSTDQLKKRLEDVKSS